MSNIASQKNIGAFISMRRLSDQAALTAAGSGDATTVTGQTIDRQGFGAGTLPLSMDAMVAYSATLASGATLSVLFDIQDSADNSTFADYATTASTVAATGPSGGGLVRGQASFPVNLHGARRYVRLLYVPDLSATGTDTAVVSAAAAFGGFDRLAAPV